MTLGMLSKGRYDAGAILIWAAYAATWGHGDLQAWNAAYGMSGFIVLQQLESGIKFMASVTIKYFADAQRPVRHLRPCCYRGGFDTTRAMLIWVPYAAIANLELAYWFIIYLYILVRWEKISVFRLLDLECCLLLL